MPSNYKISKKTDQDINHITKRSLHDFGEQQTIKYISGLKETLQKIADSPAFGRNLASNERYRHYPYESHVIYYRERKNDILIVRVLHKKMLPEKHL